MNCYEKLTNFLANARVSINYETARKNAFPNLLLNRFDEIINRIEFNKTGVEAMPEDIVDAMRNATSITEDNINYVKANPMEPFRITKNKRTIHIVGNTIWFNTNLHSYVDAFEDPSMSFLLAFIISQRLRLKLNADDLKEPKGNISELIDRALLRNGFKYLKEKNIDVVLMKKSEEVNTCHREIERLKMQINSINQEMKELENSLLYNAVESNSDQAIDYILKHRMINKNSLSYQTGSNNSVIIKFTTEDLFAYKLNIAYLERSKARLFAHKPKFNKHLQDIIDGKTKIYVGRYEFSILLDRNRMQITYRPLDTNYQNPHAKISCMGTARYDYDNAVKDFQIIDTLNIVFEHLQAINFGDPGSNSTPDVCKLYKEGELVYDPHNPIETESQTRNYTAEENSARYRGNDAADAAAYARNVEGLREHTEPLIEGQTVSTSTHPIWNETEANSEPESGTEDSDSNESR